MEAVRINIPLYLLGTPIKLDLIPPKLPVFTNDVISTSLEYEGNYHVDIVFSRIIVSVPKQDIIVITNIDPTRTGNRFGDHDNLDTRDTSQDYEVSVIILLLLLLYYD